MKKNIFNKLGVLSLLTLTSTVALAESNGYSYRRVGQPEAQYYYTQQGQIIVHGGYLPRQQASEELQASGSMLQRPVSSSVSNAVRVPESFMRTEPLSLMYQDYVSKSFVPEAQALKPNDMIGFQCHIFSADSDTPREYQLFFVDVPTANNRFLRLRLEDPTNDKKQNFVLVRSQYGWRGQMDEPKSTYDIPIPRPDPRYNKTIIQSGMVRVFDTIGISENKSAPGELFVELGTKTDTLFLDFHNKPIFDRSVSYDRFAEPSVSIGQMTDSYIKQVNGNASAAPSYVYKDNQNSNFRFNTHAIGICNKIQ